ncbi:hypothetical protein Acr_22g0006410 [Actinidia rufa]|uniref:Uncharacterized protein n=1 Tax=Actinidia rufa TaxID=165716 RepID=A0A7J0GKB3_9ERIC|nr:hypothetical protein Acr_22g0006410 [Actinidia rufa]
MKREIVKDNKEIHRKTVIEGKHRCLAIAMKQARGPCAVARSKKLPSTGTVLAESSITSEMSLYSKLGKVITPKFGQGATVGDDPESAHPDTSRAAVCLVTRQLALKACAKLCYIRLALILYKTYAKTTMMASHSNNCFNSQKTRRKPPHAPRTHGDRGVKLLADAQRMTKATSRLLKPTQVVEKGSFKEGSKRSKLSPREGQNRRQRQSHVSLESQSDSKSVTSSRGCPQVESTSIGTSTRLSMPSEIEKAIYILSSITEQ